VKSFFIVRDPTGYGDIATVWNFREREWCWDVDGEYTHEDGFEYFNFISARDRARTIISNGGTLYPTERNIYKNIRVVSRKELFIIRDTNDPRIKPAKSWENQRQGSLF
jgi:hypothetical protein